jgi:aldehyde:ferredoxin oxidoreductase
LTPNDFVLPGRSVGEPPQEEGPHKGLNIDHKTLAKNFFAAMQWDETTGKPGSEMLASLGGLEDVITDLYG